MVIGVEVDVQEPDTASRERLSDGPHDGGVSTLGDVGDGQQGV